MDEHIVSDALTKRKSKALAIAEAGLVSPNGLVGQYYVTSQSGNGRYLAATQATFPPAGRCTCPDFQKRGGPCKHILAAELYEAAEARVEALATRHDLTFDALANRIVTDLCAGVPDPATAQRLTILLHAAWRLQDKE